MEAIPELSERFDAIVVDEGQDIRDNWWITLESLLNDPDDGVLFIFQDPHQAIYHRNADLPITTPPLDLPSQLPHHGQHSRADGDVLPRASGTGGHRTTWPASGHDRGDSDGIVREIRKVLTQLLDEEGLGTDQIVILTPSSKSRSILKDGMHLGNRTLSWELPLTLNQIQVSSIHAFKGLERDVVILTETDRLATMPGTRQLSYVALSRAKHHLIVIGSLPSSVFTDADVIA
jgi:superfamily I DNA/RNA helicase